jgi:hypothetical protein
MSSLYSSSIWLPPTSQGKKSLDPRPYDLFLYLPAYAHPICGLEDTHQDFHAVDEHHQVMVLGLSN